MNKLNNEDFWFTLEEEDIEGYYSAHITMVINETGEDWCREHNCDLGYLTYKVTNGLLEWCGEPCIHPAYQDQERTILNAVDPHISDQTPESASCGRGDSVQLDHSEWAAKNL